MMVLREDLVGKSIGLFDSANGESLFVTKAVEITGDCPTPGKGQRVILRYTRAVRDAIVQICHTYPGEEEMGASVHNHLGDIRDRLEGHDITAVFRRWADEFGLTPEALAKLVLDNAPAN